MHQHGFANPGEGRVTGKLTSIGVQCGSHPGMNPAFMTAASEVGKALASAGICVVYGGVRTGLMGALADSVLEHGGCVIGVIPQCLADEGLAHGGLSELNIVSTMNERKTRMLELSEATMILPGGVGTQDEFWEYLAAAQLGFHAKPCGILNVDGYYDPLLAFIDRALAEGFLSAADKRNVVVGQSEVALIAELSQRVSG
jgi:uncharacterized protein (TIGR00730 family)